MDSVLVVPSLLISSESSLPFGLGLSKWSSVGEEEWKRPLIALAGWRPVEDERSPDRDLEDDLSELRVSIERRTEQV